MSKAARAAKALAASLLVSGLPVSAFADSCEKSRDFILEGLAGELNRPARFYQDLFKACQETLSFPNVKDAYITKKGAIAIDPARNTVMATAPTLAQFCQRFPHSTVVFMTPREQRQARTVGVIVMLPAANATSCSKVGGAT
jgi:hypothetical protein